MKLGANGERDSGAGLAARAGDWSREFHARQGVPAMSFAVAGTDGPIWSAAHGLADIETGTLVRTGHRFRLGSVSKVITTTLAAKLVSRKLVDLDCSIAYRLPELPAHHRQTTLRQLFTHQGGVRHYLPQEYNTTAPGGSIIQRQYASREEVMALFIEDPLVAEPGTKVSYSSYGYTLASIVLEAATREDFLEMVADELARPFGVPSLAADDVTMNLPDRVSGYFTARELNQLAAMMPGIQLPSLVGDYAPMGLSNPAFCWAGAGLIASMPDLARFGAALLEGPNTQITPEERTLLFTPLTQASPASPPLGLGWRVDHDAQGRLRWHHAGTTPGGRCGLVIYPDMGMSVALASNTMITPGDVLGPAAELAELFAPLD